MIDIHQALKKAKKLDLSDWRRLILLSLGAFLLGLSTTFLDIGAVSLFLQKNTFYAIGFDFLVVALLLVWVGSITVKLDRRHGYGGVPLTAFLTLLLFGILNGIDLFSGSLIPVNILFIYKYLMPVLVAMSFWTIASRFIVLKLNSLKYMGVLSASLLGIYFGGLILSGKNYSANDALMGAVWGFVGLTVCMKILVWLLPQPDETFVPKTGGVQDLSERKMIDCILMLAFVYTLGRTLTDYLLYQSLTATPQPFSILSHLWMNCGGFGFLTLIVLSQTRFLYTTLWGLGALCLGMLFFAEGAFLGASSLLYPGFIVVWICSFLYWSPYLSLLPRPLTLGEGVRLRKLRQMMIEPLAFVLAGSFILTLPKTVLSIILMGASLFLISLIIISSLLYGRLLYQLCQMRFWCGGPLMLVSDKLIQYIKHGIENNSFQDVVYFLRIMEIAHFPGYLTSLFKALKHPVKEVRLFALDKLDVHGIHNHKVIQTLHTVFQKDKEVLVRARALAVLIHHEGDGNTQNIYQKYGTYLDDKSLKVGAIMGFLQVGGEWALLAMDGLQKLALSHSKTDNLMALSLIDKVPQKGLVRLVLPLLKSPYPEVVQQALLVAGRIGHTQSLSFVFQALDDPTLQEQALQALSMYGKTAFPPLEKMLQNPCVPFDRRKILISFLGLLPSGEGKQILLRNLYLSDQKMRKEVFGAVLNSKIVWISRGRKKILKQGLMQDISWWHLLGKNIQLCQHVPVPALGDSFSSLRHSFEEMRQDLRSLILDQLILLKPTSLVKKAISILRGTPSQKFISAAGILQDLLPASVYQQVRPVLLYSVLDKKDSKSSTMDVEQARHFLEKIILAPDFPVDRWVVATALCGLQKIGNEGTKAVLNKAFLWPSPVVLEAALELLTHLEPSVKKREEYLNKQIHTIPRNLILDDYLHHRRKNDYL